MKEHIQERVYPPPVPEFETAFRLMYSTLCRFALHFTVEEEQAEDLVQDAFLQTWKVYGKFDNFLQIKAFLYKTVKNNAINRSKRQRVEEKYCNSIPSDVHEANIECYIIEEETYRILEQIIEKLPNRTQEIIRLSMELKSNYEIALELNISVETVRTLKKRAYKTIKKEVHPTNAYFLFKRLLKNKLEFISLN